MEVFVLYLLKSGLWLTAFSVVYWLFLRKETFYQFNRLFLLFGILAAFLFPFLQYRYELIVEVSKVSIPSVQAGQEAVANSLNWRLLALGSYLLVVGCFLIKQLLDFRKIIQLINKYGYSLKDDYKVVNSEELKGSFSFFNYIFFNSSLSTGFNTEQELIWRHELAHIRQYHWVDLVLSHLLCCLQWFNPIAWFYLRAIRKNHEYLADKAVLQNGTSSAVYRAVLVNCSLNIPVFAFTNSFTYKHKFNRIVMMNKQVSNPLKKAVTLLLIPAFATFLWAFAEPEYVLIQGETKTVENDSSKQGKTSHPTKTTHHFQYIQVDKPDKKTNKKTHLQEVFIFSDSTQIAEDKQQGVLISRSEHSKAPLIILDGEVIESTDKVNPEDIESVSVLKDTVSTGTYGKEGKHGVILITSKKGKEKKN